MKQSNASNAMYNAAMQSKAIAMQATQTMQSQAKQAKQIKEQREARKASKAKQSKAEQRMIASSNPRHRMQSTIVTRSLTTIVASRPGLPAAVGASSSIGPAAAVALRPRVKRCNL
jgi:hypothetical protein